MFVGQTSNSSLSVNHRLSNKSSVNGRLAYSEGNVQGAGLDLGWTQRGKLRGSDANWRLSVFDRPGTSSTSDRRNRGVDLSFSVALGGPGEYWSGSIGTRTSREGDRDNNASLTYRRDLQDHVLQSVSGTALVDTYGVGLSGIASFSTESLYGDGFLQRSSYNDNLTGGLNLSSTVAVGGQKAVFTGVPQGRGAGMIVDVETDLDDIVLRADDLTGGSTTLHPAVISCRSPPTATAWSPSTSKACIRQRRASSRHAPVIT